MALAGIEAWPGDREGRSLLGQTLTAQATGMSSHQADLVASSPTCFCQRAHSQTGKADGTILGNVVDGWRLSSDIGCFARLTKRTELVAIADKVFATYKQHAMTDHFANDNWFGKPRWTEGCAIIDSFELAMLLWQGTGKVGYLEDAQHIYFNGIGFNQRPNGGSNGTTYLAPYVVRRQGAVALG